MNAGTSCYQNSGLATGPISGERTMQNSWAGYLAMAGLLQVGVASADDQGDLFAKLDKNQDGFVTESEVPDEQKALYERLLRNADKDSDKKLNKEEFLTGLKPSDAAKTPLGAPGAGGRPGPSGAPG